MHLSLRHLMKCIVPLVLLLGMTMPVWADEPPAASDVRSSPLQTALAAYEKNPKLDEYRALQAAQKAFAKSGAAPNEISFKAMGILQDLAFANRQWREAQKLGLQRIVAFHALNKTDDKLLTDIHIDTGMAYLVSKRKRDLWPAKEQFDLAVETANDHDYLHVSEDYLRARSWGALTRAIMMTRHVPGPKKKKDKEDEEENLGNFPGKCIALNKQVKWISRMPPKFPRDAARSGYVGAIVLLYDMQPDGRPGNIRIGGEAPEALFGESAVEAAKKWKAKLPPDYPPECGKNAITEVIYVLRG